MRYISHGSKHTTHDHSGLLFNHVRTFMAWLEDLPFLKRPCGGLLQPFKHCSESKLHREAINTAHLCDGPAAAVQFSLGCRLGSHPMSSLGFFWLPLARLSVLLWAHCGLTNLRWCIVSHSHILGHLFLLETPSTSQPPLDQNLMVQGNSPPTSAEPGSGSGKGPGDSG